MGKQNKELLKNIKKLDEKEKVKQQKPEILSKTTRYRGEESKYRESRNCSVQ